MPDSIKGLFILGTALQTFGLFVYAGAFFWNGKIVRHNSRLIALSELPTLVGMAIVITVLFNYPEHMWADFLMTNRSLHSYAGLGLLAAFFIVRIGRRSVFGENTDSARRGHILDRFEVAFQAVILLVGMLSMAFYIQASVLHYLPNILNTATR